MKKLRKIMLKSIISFVLAIALVTGAVPLPNMGGLLPNLVIKANAAEYTANPTTKDELVPLASSGSVSEAHVVKYANKEWYVIGYDGVGLASESGTMTLFLKGTLGSHEFSNNYSNVYADSSIHSYLGSYLANTANFTSNESAAVVARTLSGGASTGNSYSSHVSGDSVDANLWLLSAAEARKLPQNIIKSGGDGNGWWLRSPGSSGNANYMPVSPGMNDVPKESGAGVGYSKSVRAAMLLDLNSVIYSSETNTLIAQEAEAHNITVSVDNDQGSVVAPSRADKGETVKFTITPAVGYAVDTVKFNDTSLSPVNGVYSFTMPNSDVTISVTFNQIYKVEDHIEQDGDTYTIKTAKGWEVFCDCVKSDTYNGFWGKTVKLGLDITDGVTVSAGILGKPFYGTFDGGGHTLAVALNSTEEWVAPFSVFSGSIKNLTVTGTVAGSDYAGGLTGLALGGSIENVTVNADISGSSKIGGITGYCNFGSLLVKNTVFNGSLQCDGDVCGLIGWASENVGYNQAITIENCLFNGSYTCDGGFHPITILNSNSEFKYTVNGAYYTVVPKLSSVNYIIGAGTHVSTITADNEFEITTDPTCSFDSVDYYAEGTAISLKGSGSIKGVVVNNGAVAVTDNQNGTYSFTMPDGNVTVVNKLTQMIFFESATQTKTYGDEDFTVTATHSVGDGEVSYAVTEGTDVAEVNSSTGAVTIKKAGTAIITATAAAKNNFPEATAQYMLTVNPKSITIPTAISGLKWTGDEQTGVTDGTGYIVTNGKATDVGSYTATAVLTDKDNTKWSNGSTDDQSITWSIAKADGSAAPTGLTGTAPTTDGGSDGKISGVDSTMEYSNNSSFESATDCSGTEITGLSEGTYYVRVKETETHEAGVYATVTVPAYSDNSAMVKKAPIPKTNLVYNGSPQALVEPGEAENGTMYYAVTTTNTAPEDDLYTTSNYTAIDAGTYYVWYKVIGDANHNDSTPASVTATIAPKSLSGASVTLDKTEFTYTGSEQSVSVTSVSLDGVTLTDADYDVSGNSGTDKNEYTVTVTGKGNYKDSATTGWKIVAKAMTVTAEPVSGTYDGNEYGITVNVTEPSTGTTVKYGTEAGVYNLDASPEFKAAGTYTVYFKVSGKGNYNDYQGSATVTISKKAVTANVSAEDKTYDGKTDATVSASVASTDLIEGDSIEITGLQGNFDDANVGENKKVTVDSSSKSILGIGLDNYEVTIPAETTASISKAAPEVTAPAPKILTYTGSAQELVIAGSTTGGTMYYAVTTKNTAPTDENLYTTTIPTATDAGTYYIWYKIIAASNHNDTVPECVISEIRNYVEMPDDWNLFEDDSVHEYPVYGINAAGTIENSNKKSMQYYDAKISGSTITVALKKDLKKGDRKKAAKAANAKLEFNLGTEGVVEYILPVSYVKPVFKLSSASDTIKKGTERVLRTTLLIKSTGGDFAPYDMENVQVSGTGFQSVALDGAGEAIEITANAAGSGKINIYKPGWDETNPVSLNYKVRTSNKDVLRVDIGNQNIIAVNSNAKGQVLSFDIIFNGSAPAKEEVKLTDKKNTGLAEVSEDGKLVVVYKDGVKDGEYGITLEAGDAKTNVRIKVNSVALDKSIKLKVQRKLNVVTGQSMIVKPDMKRNLNGGIVSVDVLEEGFSATVDSVGCVAIEYDGDKYNANNLKIGTLTLNLHIGGVEKPVTMYLKNVKAVKTLPAVKADAVVISKDSVPAEGKVIGTANIESYIKLANGRMQLVDPLNVEIVSTRNVTAKVNADDKTEINIESMSKSSGSIKVKLTYKDGLTKTVVIKVKKAK